MKTMSRHALFDGLVFDEYDRPVTSTVIGENAFYVVDDAGFLRHVESEQVDRHVLEEMSKMMEGMEGDISEQAAKMMGQEDIFTKAMIENQLKNAEEQFERIFEVGIPEGTRNFLGMTGFKIRINVHGEVVDIEQAGMIDPDSE